MCGIYAEWRRSRRRRSFEDARARLDLMTHRGPDFGAMLGWSQIVGFKGEDDSSPLDVVLGHRRLSIIDLTDGGRQPMLSEDGRLCLIFNGEIYNYVELRDALHAQGRSFVTDSDTEVLMAAWLTWGPACVTRLEGMFAFLMLDTVSRHLHAVRDRFGIKPLHFIEDEEGIRFSSEIRTLVDGRNPRANLDQLFSFLRWGAVDGTEETMFRGVRQLMPAEMLTIDLDKETIHSARHWTLPMERAEAAAAAQALEDYRNAFLTTVDQQLRADVPVVATLSGGLDSTAICGAIRHLRPDSDINVFSYVAEGAASEEKWIDIVAREKRLNVTKIHVDERQVLNDLPALVRAQEQPFGSGSIYAQNKIFEAIAAAGYRVMLDGQGADECLAGYKALVPNRIRDLVRKGRLGDAVQLYRSHAARDPVTASVILQRTARLFLPTPLMPAARNAVGRSLALPFAREGWFASQGLDIRADEARQLGERETLDDALRLALQRDILPALLRYADRNAMAYSVENRVPFLSTDLVEKAFALPSELLISRDGRTKAVVRDALRDLVPEAIRDRHDKIGFRATEEQWMRADPVWMERELSACEALPFVDPQALRRSASEFMAGDDRNSQILFRLFVLRIWSEAFGVQIG